MNLGSLRSRVQGTIVAPQRGCGIHLKRKPLTLKRLNNNNNLNHLKTLSIVMAKKMRALGVDLCSQVHPFGELTTTRNLLNERGSGCGGFGVWRLGGEEFGFKVWGST